MGFSLFAKVPVYRYPEFKGLKNLRFLPPLLLGLCINVENMNYIN